jgi:hypothetical protein
MKAAATKISRAVLGGFMDFAGAFIVFSLMMLAGVAALIVSVRFFGFWWI